MGSDDVGVGCLRDATKIICSDCLFLAAVQHYVAA